jgi:ppGpp synthetase/RelA/SpoT-type nucleotidyltranferase
MSTAEKHKTLQKMVSRQVRLFKKNRRNFEQLCNTMLTTLQQASATFPGHPLIQGRVKAMDSFAEKCIRKKDKYNEPVWQLTDLCGVRVVVSSQDAIRVVTKFIEENFTILENEDTSGRLKDMEFGYQSVHYIVALNADKRDRYSTTDRKIPDELFAVRDSKEAEETGLPHGPVYRAEIQVRTLLQHAWSDSVHDNLYKTAMKKRPHHLMRQSALIAALLEDADNSITKLIEGSNEYQSFYGAYMAQDEIENEISLQEMVLRNNPDNKQVAFKIARLADSLTHQDKLGEIESILSRFENEEDALILRELGMVRWKLGNKAEGRKNIRRSTELNTKDPDTWCELGLTYFQEKYYFEALKYYTKAFEVSPAYPRAIMRYIECTILERGDGALEYLSFFRLNLEKAIDASKSRIEAGIHIPHAWYDIGFFSLLLKRIDESLDAYGKAILSTSSVEVVENVYDSLTKIHQKSYRNGVLNDNLTLVRSYLRVVLVGRFGKDPKKYLETCDYKLDGFTSLSPSICGNIPNPFSRGQEIVVVAGSCSQESLSEVLQFAPMIREAFDGFAGTICCGGTNAGISGVIGSLDDSYHSIKKIGYLPKGVSGMTEYNCIKCPTKGFSQMQPIMLWSDLLLAGVDPKSVRLLGIKGETISCLEYQLAILLGAKVGLIAESGGACRRMLDDPEWANATPYQTEGLTRNLFRLPADQETLRVFIQPVLPSKIIDAEAREKMAKEIHEEYSSCAREEAQRKMKNIASWDSLEQTYKNANFGQIDHIDAKLRRIGLTVKKSIQKKPKHYTFNEEQLSLLAEMEHGRWVIDRLDDGWTLGERNDEKKTRPQLISWNELSESEKQKDYATVKKIPEMLANQGYEILEL